VFILYNPSKYHNSGTGGRHVELGYAICRVMRIFYIGEKENIFHFLPMMQLLCSDYSDMKLVASIIAEAL
jgi:hypothetical protein